MADLAKIIIESTDKSGPGFNSAMGRMEGLGNFANELKGKLGMIGALLGGMATIHAFAGAIEDAIKFAAELNDLAQKAGTTVENMSALNNIAKLSRTDIGAVTTTLQSLSKTMYDVESGTGKALLTIQSLGLTVHDSNGQLKDNTVFLLEVAKKLDGMSNSTQRVAAAQKIFKGVGAEIMPFLHDLAEAGELNATVMDRQAQEAEQYERTLIRLNSAKKSLYNTIAQQITPVLNALTQVYLDQITGVNSLGAATKKLAADDSIRQWAINTGIAVAMAVDFVRGIGIAWQVATNMVGFSIQAQIQLMGVLADSILGAGRVMMAFGEIAAGAALNMSGNFVVGNALVMKGWDDLKAAGTGFVKDIKGAMSTTQNLMAAAKEEIDKLVMAFKPGNTAEAFLAQVAKIGEKLEKVAAAGKPIPITVKQASDAYDGLTESLGKNIAKLEAELEFMQKYGQVSKETAVATTAYSLKQMEASGLLATHAARLKTTVQTLKDFAMTQAAVSDALGGSADSEKRYIEALKSVNEAGDKEILSLTTKIATYGMADAAVTAYTITQLENARSLMMLVDGTEQYIAVIDAQIGKLKQIGQLQGSFESLKQMTNLVNQVGDAFGKTVEAFTRGWKSGVDYMRQTFKSFAADVIAFFAKKMFLQMVVGASGTFGATAASAASSALGASGNSLMGTALNAGASWLGSTALGSGFMAGLTGTVGTLAPAASSGIASYMVAAETAQMGGMAGFGASMGQGLAALGPAGWIALAALAAYAIFAQKAGGPKTGGSFQGTYDATGALRSTDPTNLFGLKSDESVGNSAVQSIAAATAKSYFEMMKKLGGSAQGLSFGLGYDSDPRGTADNRIKGLVTDAMGNTIFKEWDRAIGRDDKNIGPELQLTASRALLAALQASKLPDEIANILNSVTVSGATQTQLDDVFARATAMNDLFGAIGVSMDTALTPMKTAIELIHDQGAALAEFARTSDRSAQSLATLATSTAQYRAQVTALIAQYEDAKTAIGKTIDDTIRGFIFGGLDSQGQYNMLQSEAQGLKGKLGGMTDAATITATIAQIAQLSNQAFGLLSPAEQKAQLQEFITGLRDAQATADTRLSDLQQAATDAANQQLAEVRKNIATEAATAQMNRDTALIERETAIMNSRTAATGLRIDVGNSYATQSGS